MAQYVEGPYIVEDQPDGTRKVVGYANQQQGGPAPMTIGSPKPREPEKPQNIQRKDGSIVQVYADGTMNVLSGPVTETKGDPAKVRGTEEQRGKALQAFTDAAALRRIAADLRKRYEAGPGATKGIAGVQDFFPTEGNTGFDTAAQRARGYVKRSLGFTGGEGNVLAESEALYSPYLPNTSNWDGEILSKINALEQLAGDAERQAATILGGRPDAAGNIIPIQDTQQAPMLAPAGNIPPAGGSGPQGPDRSNPLPTGPSFGGPQGDPSGFVPYGSTTRRINNPEWAGVNEAVKGMIIAGQTPDQIRAYLGQRGINTNVEGLNQAADYFRKTGKRDFRVNVDDIEVPMSGFEQFRNNAPQTAVGAGLTTAANAVSFGIPQALAPEQMQYIRDQSPVASFVGDVAGIVGATSGIGAVGNSLARSLAPRALTGGGRFGNAVRSVAPDAVYGAAYGGITEGDPLTGAATATLGSGAGQVIGKGGQKLFQGVTDPAVQYLTARGVPLSLGETLGNNSIVGRQMQRMESIPILGDLMSARRGEARDAVYRGVLEDAVQPIGGRIDPADPLASAQQAISGAYDNAVGNVTVPFDARYFDELGNARNAASTLPPDLKGKFDAAMASRVDPLTAAPEGARTAFRGIPLGVDDPFRVHQRGPLGNGVYLTGQKENAEKYGENVINAVLPSPILDGVRGRVTPELLDQVRSQMKPEELARFERWSPPTDMGSLIDMVSRSVESERVPDIFKRMGFKGVEANVDGHEISIFDPSDLRQVGAVKGDQYQQAMRGLSGYKSEATKPGFEQDYRDAISMVQDALKGQMMRGGGDTVVTGLRNADQAYSMLKPIQNATISARGTPTPKQLQAAFTTNTKKFGGDAAAARGDKVPDIVRYAVNNAPNIGNSGTADRLAGIMPFIMPTALGGSAVGLETFTDSPFLTGSLATLAALSTRTGQKAMQTALVKRPAAVRRAGGIFGRRETQKGLAGMVTAPLLIEQ